MTCENPKCKCTNCTNYKCACEGIKECSCSPDIGSCCCNS